MPDTAFAEDHRNRGYSNAVTFEMRQRPGVLAPLVGSTENYSGQASHRITNRFDFMEMSRQEARNEDTNLTDPDSLVRWIKAEKARDVAVLIDKNDQAVTEVKLGDPIAKEIAEAAQRVHDDEWLIGFFGNGWTGETGDTPVPFDSANVIAHGAQGLTLDKLIATQELMGLNDIDFDAAPEMMPIHMITPRQRSDLLKIAEYKNSDFSGSYPLVRGEVKPFMGFRFVVFNPDSRARYKHGGALTKSGTTRKLPVFVPGGLHRGVWTEFWGDIGPRRDKKSNTQIYGEARSAVVRVDERLCYQVECTES